MILMKIFAPEKDKEQHQQEGPGGAEVRRTAVENNESAPKTAECKLRRDGQEKAPVRPRISTRLARLQPLLQRDRNEADRGIDEEYELRLQEVDTAEEETVRYKSSDHRESGKMPFVGLHPCKEPLQHMLSITCACGD